MSRIGSNPSPAIDTINRTNNETKTTTVKQTKAPTTTARVNNSFAAHNPNTITSNPVRERSGVQASVSPTALQQNIENGVYAKRGRSGESVTELQNMLNAAGIQPALETDGKFGPLTAQAVRNFQRQTGCKVDGIVGPETLGALMDPNNTNTGSAPRPVERPNRPLPGQPNAPAQPNAPGQPNAPTQPNAPAQPGVGGPADARIGNIAGMENTTPEFRQKAADIADRLGMDPKHLMAVMSFETGGSFSPSIRNKQSGATGLIQFMPSTARGLGTSTDALSRMDPMQQLDYVEKYLKPYAGKMNSVEDAYMAVLWPAAVGKGPNHVLFSNPSIQYRQNSGLDTNRNGNVTAYEAASKVRARILG